MRRRILIIFLTALFITYDLPSYSQITHTNSIIEALQKYSQKHATEKVYLHFDKPYYAAGDTMYFRAYVTAGERHQLSALSKVLHLDLISTNNKIDQNIQLEVVNGMSSGDFTLPDSLSKGNYRVRAYTQWMRNEGNYFEQTFPVGSLQVKKIPESSTTKAKALSTKPDLQFFPEGGQLLVDVPSKIAFKSIGTNGMEMDVKGVITDNNSNEVCRFISAHLGMGYFYLRPEEGKSYRASLTYADGTQNTVDLPLSYTKGISLSVNNDSIPEATVKIEASKTYYLENKGKAYILLIYSGGQATTVDIKLDSAVVCLDILKRRLFTGITRITLFSADNEPLSERLIFIQNYDQLNPGLSTDKITYAAREKVNLKLNARNRADSVVMGHFSVSVIDESKVKVDENTETTILTDLLLTSDLKGTVEQPNYYFTNINDETLCNLDLVMLTNGYRKFEWKPLLNNQYSDMAYQPEKGLEIRGIAKNLFGKPLPKASVTLISPSNNTFESTLTDNKGNFSFNNLLFTDTAKFILQAAKIDGSNNTKLIYNTNEQPGPPLFVPEVSYIDTPAMYTYLENIKKQNNNLSKFIDPKGRVLKEVRIREIKVDDKYETQSLAGAGNADQVWHRKDIHGGGSLTDQLDGLLIGIKFIGRIDKIPYYNGGPMLIVLDGAVGADFPSINLSDVETVEVLKYASASIYGMNGAHGVLVITTRKGSNLDPKDIASVGILPIKARGFYKAREFYLPKYESSMPTKRPDLRSTIYWNPEVATDKNGNASFDYYNADGNGNYRVVIEGIDERGNIGRQVYRYKVE